jgi:hypothetical protein
MEGTLAEVNKLRANSAMEFHVEQRLFDLRQFPIESNASGYAIAVLIKDIDKDQHGSGN